MANTYGKTISTKVEKDITNHYHDVLKQNGHTSTMVLRAAILEYIKRYSDDEGFINYVTNIQFE